MTVEGRFFEVASAFEVMTLGLERREAVPVLQWADAGLTVRTVRGRKMRQRPGVFDEFAAALQFPSYFGENLDAFDECIADLDWLPPGQGYVVVVTEPDQVLMGEPGLLSWLVETLAGASEDLGRPIELGEWWDRPAVPFHVVLAGESAVIDRARERWTAAGASLSA